MSDVQCGFQTGADPPAITPCTTFTLFPKLAPELRLKIWKQALPGPRLVEMRPDKHPLTNSHSSTPSVLHICSESRTEALKWYTAFPLRLASDPLSVYVNFQIDTIYFSPTRDEGWRRWPGYAFEGWDALLFNNVRFMAMSYKAWLDVGYGGEAISLIQRFGNLEELNVVLFDVGTGEIDDEHELEVWDEWRIGDEVGVSIRTGEIQARGTDRELVALVEKAVMTRECGGLKNMKVRIVTVDRGGAEEIY